MASTSKKSTLRIRKSRAMPAKVQHVAGSRRYLLSKLRDRELGWCTDDHLLYIKLGKSIRAVASGGGGGSAVEIKGTTDEVVIRKDSSAGIDVYTISLADVIVNAKVPPIPEEAPAGKVLTANADGTMDWKELPVKSAKTVEL